MVWSTKTKHDFTFGVLHTQFEIAHKYDVSLRYSLHTNEAFKLVMAIVNKLPFHSGAFHKRKELKVWFVEVAIGY